MALIKRGAALVASLITFAGAAPALAASPVTVAFLANVVPNVDFLDRSSRLALKNSKNARLKAFALSEAREQTLAANSIYDWTQADAKPVTASTKELSPPSKDLDRTPTGSTVPSDWPAPQGAPAPPQSASDQRLPRGQEDLDSLEGLEGRDFDADYKDKQRDALEQVETDYRDYLAKGDEPGLLVIAKDALPRVTKRLTALRKL